jgi:hypothetical protein
MVGGIKVEPKIGRRLLHQTRHGDQTIALRGRIWRQRDRGEAIQRLRRRADGVHQLLQDGAKRAAQLLHRSGILAVKRRDDRRRIRDAGLAQIGERQHRRVEIDHQSRDAELAQCFRRQQHGLRVGGGAFGSDEFDSRLADLAFRAHLLALHAQHLPGVGETQRTG